MKATTRESTRRNFLEQCAGIAAGACLLPQVLTAAGSASATKSSFLASSTFPAAFPAPSVHFPSDPRQRVAVAAYPFREFIVGWMGWDGKTPSTVPAANQIELKAFAAHVAEKFNVHKVELWSPVFPSTDEKYLAELHASITKAESAVVDIAVDAEHSQYALDAAERERAATTSKKWIDVGATLGSPSVRTHIDKAKDSKPDVGRAADTLARVAEYGAKKNVVIHLENDDPVSEDPFFIVKVIDKVNNPWLRALPDFGNSLSAHGDDFGYRAIDAMFAHAYGICHVKDGEVNDEGKAVHVDLARTFGILKKHDYKGYCSIEYDSPGDPYQATAELVKKTMEFLSAA
jgi:sugar phosphate isomerase/epimerase